MPFTHLSFKESPFSSHSQFHANAGFLDILVNSKSLDHPIKSRIPASRYYHSYVPKQPFVVPITTPSNPEFEDNVVLGNGPDYSVCE